MRRKFFASICLALAFSSANAEEIEIALRVANGVTEREFYISDPQATMMSCMFQAPLIVSKWLAENTTGTWIVRRITCGPPRREF